LYINNQVVPERQNSRQEEKPHNNLDQPVRIQIDVIHRTKTPYVTPQHNNMPKGISGLYDNYAETGLTL